MECFCKNNKFEMLTLNVTVSHLSVRENMGQKTSGSNVYALCCDMSPHARTALRSVECDE